VTTLPKAASKEQSKSLVARSQRTSPSIAKAISYVEQRQAPDEPPINADGSVSSQSISEPSISNSTIFSKPTQDGIIYKRVVESEELLEPFSKASRTEVPDTPDQREYLSEVSLIAAACNSAQLNSVLPSSPRDREQSIDRSIVVSVRKNLFETLCSVCNIQTVLVRADGKSVKW
jgi:hypothetical protein